MSPHEFSKTMKNPYFQSKYYREETPAGQMEAKVENFFKRILKKLLFWKKEKDVKF
jgi:hypothetical protein